MKRSFSVLLAITAIAIPLFLLTTSIRVLFTPLFLEVEYRMPGFPDDTYGFSMEDRLQYSNISLQYLLTRADISLLGDLKFPDGSPVFNVREISHMEDVKQVLQSMLQTWMILGLTFFMITIWAWKAGSLVEFLRSMRLGGFFTLGFIVAIFITLSLSFDWLFSAFHGIFFEGDTWLFYYSDTLIRLFPIRFWSDAFIAVGTLAALLAIGLILSTRRMEKLVNDVNKSE